MTVYADEAFLLNGAVDYLLLICAAKLGGGRIARLRLLAAALFGGLYAAAALFAPLGVLQGLPMKLVSLVIMLLIAFGAGRQTLRTGLLFLAAVCAFAGAAVLAAQLFGTGVLVLPGGTFYAVSVLGLLLLAGLLYMLCYTVFSCTAQHGGEIRTMTLLYGGNRVPVRALHDTGCKRPSFCKIASNFIQSFLLSAHHNFLRLKRALGKRPRGSVSGRPA